MTNNTRISRAGDPETEIIIFTPGLNGLYICDDDGKAYTRADLDALKSTDNKKIIKYIITCPLKMAVIQR